MKDIKALLGEKSRINPLEKEAKLKALKDMRKVAGDVMADGIKSKMQKVTVAAPDKDSLEMGLEKAKSIVEGSPMEMTEDMGEDMGEETEDEIEMDELTSVEDIDALMQKLAEKKAALLKE